MNMYESHFFPPDLYDHIKINKFKVMVLCSKYSLVQLWAYVNIVLSKDR